MQSVCVDAQGRITGVCPDDLTGGVSWHWIDTGLTPATDLCDGCGIAIYKLVDGMVMARTATEIEADAPKPETPAPTPDERIDQVEAALIELAAIVTGGV